MAARNYTNTHTATTLSSGINSSVTAISLTTTAGLPVTYPYFLVLDNGTAQVEVVLVGSAGGGTSLNVTRGQDGTTAQTHNAGASVVHAVVAADLKEPQDHIAASTNIHGLSGGAALVGTTTAQTLTNKTMSGAANTFSNIPNSALVDIAASKVTQPFTALSTGTLAATGNATVGGTLGVTGTTTAATVNATNVTASGTLGVTGNTTVGGTLGVTGATTLAAVTATGATVNGNASVTGNETVGGTLGVTGASTLGALTAASAGVTGNATVGGTLGVTGAATMAAITGTTINATTDLQLAGVSLPKGIVGGKKYTNSADRAGPITNTEALTNMDTGAYTFQANRRYWIHLFMRPGAHIAEFGVKLRLRETNISGTVVWTGFFLVPDGDEDFDQYMVAEYIPGSTASRTLVLTAETNGTDPVWFNGNQNTYDMCAVLIEDKGGASPNPVTTVP